MSQTLRQQDIIAAALQVLSEQGLQAFTMKNIAQRLNLSDAALYKHFRDKDALLLAIAQTFQASSRLLLQSLIPGDDAGTPVWDQLKTFWMGRIEQFARDPGLSMVLMADDLFRGGSPELLTLNRATQEEHAAALSRLIRAGQGQGVIRPDLEPVTVFLLLMGPLRLLVSQWRSQPEPGALLARASQFWHQLERLLRTDSVTQDTVCGTSPAG